MSDEQDGVPWEQKYMTASEVFGEECAKLRDTHPYPVVPPHTVLNQIIRYMATELWDQNFSLTEITESFEAAIRDLPRYAAGHERRSDENPKGKES